MSMGLIGRAYIDTTLDGTTTSVDTGWISLWPDSCRSGSFHWEWNGSGTATLAATVVYRCSNDPRCFPENPDMANAEFDDITAQLTNHVNPTSGSADNSFNVDNLNYDYIRIIATRSSGTGPLKLFASFRPA